MKRNHNSCTVAGFIALTLCSASQGRETPTAQTVSFDIAAPNLVQALIQFTKQSGLQLAFPIAGTDEMPAPRVVGDYTPGDALDHLLRGSGLEYEFANEKTVSVHSMREASLVRPAASSLRFASAEETSAAGADETNAKLDRNPDPSEVAQQQSVERNSNRESPRKGIPEILVKGSRSTDVDIRRTQDDIQPYVILGEKEITRSQASNVEEFLKTRLPMNTAQMTLDQEENAYINSSTINLRGLGTNQTLILVDGRRMAGGIELGGNIAQPDISGIPLASIDRIEVLPATASGIYGGGATGGVINIIRKKNYSGLNLQAKYGDVFTGSAGTFEVNASGGVSAFGGRTHVVFGISHSEADPFLVTDRDFAFRSRERLLANNPTAITEGFFPVAGTTPNVCAAEALSDTLGFCSGTPLVLDSGQVLGASITSVPAGYAGSMSDGGAALVASAGRYNIELPNDGRVMLRAPEKDAVSFSARHEFGSRVEGFLDAWGNRSRSDQSTVTGATQSFLLPADDPANPFQQPIIVRTSLPGVSFPAESRSELLQATGGIVVRLPADWSATLEQNWSRDESSFKTTTNGGLSLAGQIALRGSVLRDVNQNPVDVSQYLTPSLNDVGGPYRNQLRGTALRVSGPAFQLPSGPVTVSSLVERRETKASDAFEEQLEGVVLLPHRSQTVQSVYAEAQIPIVAGNLARPLLRGLDMQVGVRRDEYKTLSTSDTPRAPTREGPFDDASFSTNRVSSTDYIVGLKYRPAPDVSLRSSYGTGFLPPEMSQIVPFTELYDGSVTSSDPRRGNTDAYVGAPVTLVGGGNPSLKPETSKNWSVGLIYEPAAVGGMRLSVDYTRITKSGEVFLPGLEFIIQNESRFPGRVTRGNKLPEDPQDWAGPITQVDTSLVNLLSSRVQAYDFQAQYRLETERHGSFDLSIVGTRMAQFTRQLDVESPAFDSVGFSDGSLRWRAAFALAWEQGPWALSWNTQFYDSYSVRYADASSVDLSDSIERAQGSATIPSQIYHDVWARFQFGTTRVAALEGLSFSIGIQNVFNTEPPLVVSLSPQQTGAYGYSTYGDPRLRRFSIAMQKQF